MVLIFLMDGWSTGPIKDCYIYYEKAGDKFVGRSVTGISSLRKYFVMSQVHWDWTDYPSNLKDRMETLIEKNFSRRIYVSVPTFKTINFLFAYICYHYENLYAHLHPNHRLRASSMYIASGREKVLHKYAVIRYTWLSINYTPYTTGISPHVMLMAKNRGVEGRV